MKKLLASTALVAVAFAGSASAETKFGGNIENTWTNKSTKTSSVAEDGNSGIGTDIEITMQHTKELSNGWTAKIAGAIDESGEAAGTDAENDDNDLAISRSYVQLSNGGGLTLQIGTEGIQAAEYYPIPTVADISSDIGAVGSTQEYADSLNDTHALGLAYNHGFGTLEVLWAPDSGAKKDAKDADIEGSKTGNGLEVGYKWKAMDGALTGHVGWSKQNNDDDVTGHAQEKYTAASVQYNMGNVAVGFGRLESQDAGTSAQAGNVTSPTERLATTDSLGITFAASDSLSLGIQYKSTSSDEFSSDEDVTTVQAAYDFGGIGFSLSYVENENDGGTTGTDNEVLMLRTKTSF